MEIIILVTLVTDGEFGEFNKLTEEVRAKGGISKSASKFLAKFPGLLRAKRVPKEVGFLVACKNDALPKMEECENEGRFLTASLKWKLLDLECLQNHS